MGSPRYIYSNPFLGFQLLPWARLISPTQKSWEGALAKYTAKDWTSTWQNCKITLMPCFQHNIFNFYILLLIHYSNPRSALILERTSRPLCFHSFSSVSAKADIMKRKITNDTLSPCLTPTSWSISSFSFPIFTMTLRLMYSLLMLSWNLVGPRIAPVSWTLVRGCVWYRLWPGQQILHRYTGYAALGDGGWILVWSFHPDTHSSGWLRIGALCRVLLGVCSSACIGFYWRFLSRHPWGILFGICLGRLGFRSLGLVSCLLGATCSAKSLAPSQKALIRW